MRQDLPRIDQKHRTGRAQPHVMGGPLQQDHIQLPFQALQLLAQRGLPDVFARRSPTEMQFLGQGNEIPQLPKLQNQVPPSTVVRESRRHVSVVVADAAVWVRSAEAPDPAHHVGCRTDLP